MHHAVGLALDLSSDVHFRDDVAPWLGHVGMWTGTPRIGLRSHEWALPSLSHHFIGP